MRRTGSRVPLLLAALVAGCSSRPLESTSEEAPLTADEERATRVLFFQSPAPLTCAPLRGDERVRCLISERYASDAAARELALDLHRTTGGIAGVLPEQEIDGGYRGHIRLVPELPVGAHKKHLAYVRDAMADLSRFFDGIRRVSGTEPAYRFRGVDFRFFRSVGRTTPSAFVEGDWEVAYNVSGSLHSSEEAVRETIFHELFHVNDGKRRDWSSRALAPLLQRIVAKCGTNTTCLTPYTPTTTKAAGGTYYAFQPNQNPIEVEYSAELAIRYYREQREMMTTGRLRGRAFKCGPEENAQAWSLLVTEFFGGADLVPGC